jgi:hypothetical protein
MRWVDVAPSVPSLVRCGSQLTRELEAATLCVAAFVFHEGFVAERIESPRRGRSIAGMSEGVDPAHGDDLESLNLTEEERAVLAKVGTILRRLSFGTVVLVVQDGKVVQIEMAEKFRLR